MKFAAVAVTALSLALTAQAGDNKKDDPTRIGHRGVGKGLNFYSIEKEMALGRQLAQEVRRQAIILDDPILSEYVNRLGQNLARNSDARVPFTFQIIEDETLNAFALPGGYVFVNTGLIEMADEEDELAAALAHEIAHVAARHMTRQMTKSQLAGLMSQPLGSILGGWTGYAARQAASAGLPMMFLEFDRRDEAEADYLGVQYLYAAGYDPNGAISIFEKLQALDRAHPGIVARVFSTHPMDSTRIENAQKEIQRILPARPAYIVTTSEFLDVRRRLVRLEDERSRVRAADPAAQPTMRRETGR